MILFSVRPEIDTRDRARDDSNSSNPVRYPSRAMRLLLMSLRAGGEAIPLRTGLALTMVLLLSLGATAHAGEAETPPAPDVETVKRVPTIRAITTPQRFRFAPRADMTTAELDQLRPYLDGKPLYEDDRKTLGPAMRHLQEIK